MKDNIISITGIPTPRFRAQKIRQDLDPDLFPKMLANHPEHIQRSKAKRDRVEAERKRKAKERARKAKEDQNFVTFLSYLSISLTLVIMVMVALW